MLVARLRNVLHVASYFSYSAIYLTLYFWYEPKRLLLFAFEETKSDRHLHTYKLCQRRTKLNRKFDGTSNAIHKCYFTTQNRWNFPWNFPNLTGMSWRKVQIFWMFWNVPISFRSIPVGILIFPFRKMSRPSFESNIHIICRLQNASHISWNSTLNVQACEFLMSHDFKNSSNERQKLWFTRLAV